MSQYANIKKDFIKRLRKYSWSPNSRLRPSLKKNRKGILETKREWIRVESCDCVCCLPAGRSSSSPKNNGSKTTEGETLNQNQVSIDDTVIEMKTNPPPAKKTQSAEQVGSELQQNSCADNCTSTKGDDFWPEELHPKKKHNGERYGYYVNQDVRRDPRKKFLRQYYSGTQY